MENNYNKCPFCGTATEHRGGGLQFEYVQYRECPKCGAIFKNLYMLEYHGREIIIPPQKNEVEEDES